MLLPLLKVQHIAIQVLLDELCFALCVTTVTDFYSLSSVLRVLTNICKTLTTTATFCDTTHTKYCCV
jgi:hypothetical protein